MEANEKLIPSAIIAQSNAAIRKLQEDNEFLRGTESAMTGFINDGSIAGESFNNIKLKMEDYQRIVASFVMANDGDIADHQSLIRLVEGEPGDLIGSVIIEGIESSERGRDCAIREIDRLRQVQEEANFLQNLGQAALWVWPWSSSTGQRIRDAERLRDCYIASIRRFREKQDRFREIEQSSKEFFTIGTDLRAKAKQGIRHVAYASLGLPDSFDSVDLAEWRGDIQAQKEAAISQILNRLATFDDDGNIIAYDWEAIEYMLTLPYDHITDGMWMALAILFTGLDASEGIEPNDLTRFIHLLAIEQEVRGATRTTRRTEWMLCPDRLVRLQQGIYEMELRTMASSMYIRGLRGTDLDDFIESLPPEELQRIIAMSVHPDPTPAELRDLIADQIDMQQQGLFGRRGILGTLGTLGDFEWRESNFGTITDFNGNLTGEYGATAPSLNIVLDQRGSYNLTFTKRSVTLVPNMTPPRGVAVPPTPLTLPQHEHTFVISPGLDSSGISRRVINNTENFHNDMFSFDLAGHIEKEFVNFMIGLIPIPGSEIVSTVVGAGVSLIGPILDVPLGYREEASNLSTARAVTGNSRAAHMAWELDLIGFTVDDGRGGALTVMLQPTATSQIELNRLNHEQGTSFTLEQVLDNPAEIFGELFPGY